MIKIILLVVAAYFAYAVFQASKLVKKQQEQMLNEFSEKQEKYRHIDSELFDSLEVSQLKDAILAHLFAKEDEDFEHLNDHLTDGERVVWTIYNMEMAVDEGRGSVHNFFTSPSKAYLPYLINSFEALGNVKFTDLIKKTLSLKLQEQTGNFEEVEGEEIPSFQTYTLDFMDLVSSEDLNLLVGNYIKNHKEDFLN